MPSRRHLLAAALEDHVAVVDEDHRRRVLMPAHRTPRVGAGHEAHAVVELDGVPDRAVGFRFVGLFVDRGALDLQELDDYHRFSPETQPKA